MSRTRLFRIGKRIGLLWPHIGRSVRICENGALIATRARLTGRRKRPVLTRHAMPQRIMQCEKEDVIVLSPSYAFAQRPLAVYDFIAKQIGAKVEP